MCSSNETLNESWTSESLNHIGLFVQFTLFLQTWSLFSSPVTSFSSPVTWQWRRRDFQFERAALRSPPKCSHQQILTCILYLQILTCILCWWQWSMMTETWTGWISCWPTPSLADSQRGRSHRRAADWGYKMMMLAMVNCTIITIAVIIMIIAYIIVIKTYWCAILVVEFCLFRWMTLEILMNLDCWKGLDNLEIWITVE